MQVTSGVCAEECADLLKGFFQKRRSENALEKQKVYRERSSVVVIHDHKILGFHAVDPHSQKPYFFIPGGKVEPGETAAQSAQRECLEETGYQVRVHEATALTKKYDFTWNGILHACHTTFYLGTLAQDWSPPQEVVDADYHQGVAWVDIKKVPEVFSYNKDILMAVQKLLKKARHKSALR